MGISQECWLNILPRTRQPFTINNYISQNVSSAEIEKSWDPGQTRDRNEVPGFDHE